MAELRDLENDVAITLLNSIKAKATVDNIDEIGTAGWLDLAQAYATVVGAAPGPDPRPTRISR